MTFKTVRLVIRNFGKGGCDFWEVQIRSWWFPFWVVNAWSTQYDAVKRRYDEICNPPKSAYVFRVLESYPRDSKPE